MIISMIVAVDEQGGIGKDNRLPWHLSEDLKRFKSLTMGHYLIMGRKTFQSIGRPLPGRKIVVISHHPEQWLQPGVQGTGSLASALDLARQSGETEAFIAGGAQIFGQALPIANRLYLTRVHATLPADVFFPSIDSTRWVETSREFHPADEKNEYSFTFIIFFHS